MARYQVIAALILGLVIWENYAETDIRSRINQIPGLENFDTSKLPTPDDVRDAVKNKCKENNAPEDSLDKIKAGAEKLKECIMEEKFNFTQIQEEVEQSKKTGSMDEVFAKYCNKIPKLKECGNDMRNAIDACLDSNERENARILRNITESLIEFACYKDGDRIAMFVAEGGFECIDSKKTNIYKCVNSTIQPQIPTDLSINKLPTFEFSKKNCDDLATIQSCVVTELEGCTDYTPANIVDSLFKFIRRVSPCKNKKN